MISFIYKMYCLALQKLDETCVIREETIVENGDADVSNGVLSYDF